MSQIYRFLWVDPLSLRISDECISHSDDQNLKNTRPMDKLNGKKVFCPECTGEFWVLRSKLGHNITLNIFRATDHRDPDAVADAVTRARKYKPSVWGSTRKRYDFVFGCLRKKATRNHKMIRYARVGPWRLVVWIHAWLIHQSSVLRRCTSRTMHWKD